MKHKTIKNSKQTINNFVDYVKERSSRKHICRIDKLERENAELRDIIKRAQNELVEGSGGDDDNYFVAVKILDEALVAKGAKRHEG